MKTLLLVLLTCVLATPANAAYQCTDKDRAAKLSISPQQWEVLGEAYGVGASHNMGYTMMAIAWQESKGGKYLMNIQTNDFGVMGVSLKYAAIRNKVKGPWALNMLAQRLTFDRAFNMDNALKTLLFWEKATGSWRDMVSAYNNGYAYNKGSVYLNKIVRNVNMFMHC